MDSNHDIDIDIEKQINVDQITLEYIQRLKNLNTLLEMRVLANKKIVACLETKYNEIQTLKEQQNM
jgi:hypothetical protein